MYTWTYISMIKKKYLKWQKPFLEKKIIWSLIWLFSLSHVPEGGIFDIYTWRATYRGDQKVFASFSGLVQYTL